MFLLCHRWLTTTNLSYSCLFLKLPPPPCAVLLVNCILQIVDCICTVDCRLVCWICIYTYIYILYIYIYIHIGTLGFTLDDKLGTAGSKKSLSLSLWNSNRLLRFGERTLISRVFLEGTVSPQSIYMRGKFDEVPKYDFFPKKVYCLLLASWCLCYGWQECNVLCWQILFGIYIWYIFFDKGVFFQAFSFLVVPAKCSVFFQGTLQDPAYTF